jgi:hypothetical protein
LKSKAAGAESLAGTVMNEPSHRISTLRGLAFVFVYGGILEAVALGGVYFGTRIVYASWLIATKAHPANVYDCPWWVVAGSYGPGIAMLLVFIWGLRKTGLDVKLTKVLLR